MRAPLAGSCLILALGACALPSAELPPPASAELEPQPEPEPEPLRTPVPIPKAEPEPELDPDEPPAGRPTLKLEVTQLRIVGGDQRGSYQNLVRQAIRQASRRLAQCSNHRPNHSGEAEIELAIGSNGRVQGTAVVRSDLDGRVRRCLQARLADLRYPEQANTNVATVVLKLSP